MKKKEEEERRSESDRKVKTFLCSFEGTKRGRAEARAKPGTEKYRISGDNSLRDPPVPIPNTEVKPQHADSTWLETAR